MNQYTSDPLERMLELGMGLSVAQQMMKTMNQCMAQTQVPQVTMPAPQMPGSCQTSQAAQQANFYIVANEAVAGPFTDDQLMSLARQKVLTADTFVWRKGMDQWLQARMVPEINKFLLLTGNEI